MADTSTELGGVKFAGFVHNASGPKDVTYEELKVIAQSQSAAVMFKTCTVEPRQGNPEPRYHDLPLGSLNSMGLPNLGYQEYVKIAAKLKQEFDKPLIASMAGMKPEDFPAMMKALQQSAVDLIEVNLSCPNLCGKPQIAYDFEKSREVLRSICDLGEKPFGVKISPFFDPVHFDQMADVLKAFPISFLTCINSIGNALVIDPETETVVIKPKQGFGGLGGEYIKPTSLANVHAFYQRLHKKGIKIIGCGGITTGSDAFEFLLAGASAVQLGTIFMKEGPGCFGRVERELKELLQRKGYKNINDVCGKLRYL